MTRAGLFAGVPLAILAAGLLVGSALLSGCVDSSRDGVDDPAPETEAAAPSPAAPTTRTGEPPVPRLVDITADAGLDFVHVHGGSGRRYMIETMTGGAGMVDVDGDGLLDLYFVQSGPLPGFTETSPADPAYRDDQYSNRLYRNRGDGTFEDITERSGDAADTGYGLGVCAGDIDNDGDLDLYVTNLEQDVLLRGRGDGWFDDITAAAGIDSPTYGSSCAFGDYDRDGCLDLYVVGFVDFALDNHIECGAEELRTYCSPDAYNGLPDQLYRGRCENGVADGTFEDVTERAGVFERDPRQGKGLGVLWSDLDDDGDLDLFVSNDSTRNFLYRNQGDGTFVEEGVLAGVAFNDRGVTEASMGIDAGDVDGDGWLDLFATHLDFETNTLYRNLGGRQFLDATAAMRLSAPSALRVGFGTRFFDVEHDGDLDLYVANGHIIDNIALRNPTLSYEQTDQLLLHVGDRFVDVSERAGDAFARPGVGRAVAVGDIDQDGDLDVLVAHSNRPPVLLQNRLEALPEAGHWLMLRLLSRHGGRDAIGAQVRVVAGDENGERQWIGEVRSGASYLAQGDLRLHFGLGDIDRVDRVEIRWPDGPKDLQVLDGDAFPLDRLHVVRQPDPASTLDSEDDR